MKKLFIFLSNVLLITTLHAQTLFLENFETSPVTSILNTWTGETQLPEGPPTCGKGSRGTTSDFNSTDVNFNNAQNSTYFLGVNPQSPCGGFYTATLMTDTLNFSGQDSLRFKCRYFKSTTLGWGPTSCMVVFAAGVSTYTISSQFSTTDNWSNLDVALPGFLIAPAVTFTITMGGGEGVGFDDIEVENISPTGVSNLQNHDGIKVVPNPSNGKITIQNNLYHSFVISRMEIYNVFGEKIYGGNSGFADSGNTNPPMYQNTIDLSFAPSGIYFLKIYINEAGFTINKIVVIS